MAFFNDVGAEKYFQNQAAIESATMQKTKASNDEQAVYPSW